MMPMLQKLIVSACLILPVFGCSSGSKGPTLYPISGTVTFNGQPLPAGTVEIEPDASKGGKGPAISARVINGKFQTERGRGTAGGPHVVFISGSDGKPVTLPGGMEIAEGTSLFQGYRTTVELPMKPHVQDFDVPPPVVKVAKKR